MWIILPLCVLFACKKDVTDTGNDPAPRTFSGKVQKGPFISGTSITLNELNADLGQTGKSFTASIMSNDGAFEFSRIQIEPAPALLTANGFYFHELYGELSYAPVTLQALVNLSGTSKVNVNIMTHLIKDRIMNLVSSGASFQVAKEQAQDELLAFFGITLPDGQTDFEIADISQESELNAVLLAVSVVVQRYTMNMNEKPSLTAELTQLLSNMSNDFKEDGLITTPFVKDTILHNISMANLPAIRQNLENRYAELGISAAVPGFEPYVSVIQKHFSGSVNTEYTYPDMASPYFMFQSDTSAWVDNLLNMNTVSYGTNRDYSVAAIVPFDSALTVKLIINQGLYAITPVYHGWEMVQHDQSGFTIRSILQNTLITMPVGFMSAGTAVLEFYKNDETVPYRVKNITYP